MPEITIISESSLKKQKLEDAEVVPGTFPIPGATKPRFIATIDDNIWPLVQGSIEQLGTSLTGVFNFDCIYSQVAGRNSLLTGQVEKDSPLGKLIAISDPNKILDELESTPLEARHRCKIFGGYSDKEDLKPEDLDMLFDGFVDKVSGSIINNTVSVQGKDPSVIFAETFTHAQFRNQTITEVVAEIATRYGFSALIVDNGMPIGDVYDYERINFEFQSSQGINNWEILSKLADYMGYRVFCIGLKLFFVPIEFAEKVMAFTLGDNIQDLDFDKNFSVGASRISVQLLSINLKRKENIGVTAGQPRSESGAKGDVISFTFTNIQGDAEQLGILAESMVLKLAQLEFVCSISSVGYIGQSILYGLEVRGTGSDFDRRYQLAKLKWDFSQDQGWHAELVGLSVPEGAVASLGKKRTRYGITSGGR